MKQSLFGLLLFVLYGLTTCRTGIKVHFYVRTPMTCLSAQKYCKEFYEDLSIVSDNEDLQKLKEAAGGTYSDSWIHGNENSCKSLNYVDTVASSVENLLQQLPFCAITYGVRLSIPCSNKISFFCYENAFVEQEKKTWNEALEYCRSHYSDLATFPFDWPENQIKNETSDAQSESVWTGLRFLSGNWYWLHGENFQNDPSLPSCPSEPYRCGARNTKKERWENRDCGDKLSFLCVQK